MKKKLLPWTKLLTIGIVFFLSIPGKVLAGDVEAPYQWLPQITGTGVVSVRTNGLDYIKTQVVPFLVTGSLFIAIILALIFLMIGGIRMMMSEGDSKNITAARSIIMYALVGLGLALFSFMILGAIQYIFHLDLGLPRWIGTPPPCTHGRCP